MRILWLCNSVFTTEKISGTGSWLQPLAELLVSNGIELYTIAESKDAPKDYENVNGIFQYYIPKFKHKSYRQIPNSKTRVFVRKLIKRIAPDIIHIWGTEYIWAYMNLAGDFNGHNVLLDIQGLLHVYTKYYYGGLSNHDILKCIHLKEILLPWRNLYWKKNVFERRGEIEIKSIRSFQHISYQSEWVKHHISLINHDALLYPTKIILRPSFYTAQQWHYRSAENRPVIFTMCSDAISYKGIHILLSSVEILKSFFPNLELRVAGNMSVGNLFTDGYSLYIKSLVKKYGLTQNVTFLGSIHEEQIITELQKANVCVIPSFVETYCLALAEAMIIGTPTVVSYTSALAELAEDRKDCLFYNSMDEVSCAMNMKELIENKELASTISDNARSKKMRDNQQDSVVKQQITIYQQIINEKKDN